MKQYTPPTTENEFGKHYGQLVSKLQAFKVVLQAFSFVIAFSAITGVIGSSLGKIGIQIAENANLGVFALAFAFGIALEWMHHHVPRALWWAVFRFRVVCGSVMGVLFALIILAITIGLTIASQKTSQQGGVNVAIRAYQEPTKADLSSEVAAYRQDSSAIAQAIATEVEAETTKANAEIQAVTAAYDAKIQDAKATASAKLAIYTKNNVHGWAKAESKNYTRKANNLEAEKATKVAEMRATLSTTLATLKKAHTSNLGTSLAQLQQARSTAQTDYNRKLSQAQAENEKMVGLYGGAGFWVVPLILLLSFIIEAYFFGAGYTYNGLAFSMGSRVGSWMEKIKGMALGKVDHLEKRLDATASHLEQGRGEAQPFSLPSGRFLFSGLAVVLIVFAVSQTFVYSQSQYIEAQLVPFPWNWGLLIVGVLVGWFTLKPDNRQLPTASDSSAISQPTTTDKQPTTDNEKVIFRFQEPTTDNLSRQPESVVRQQTDSFQPTVLEAKPTTPDNSQPTTDNQPTTEPTTADSEEEADYTSASPAEVQKALERCRKYWERSHESATLATRERNKAGYLREKKALSHLGYTFQFGEKITKTVKQDGKPKQVSYRKLSINE